MYGATLKQDFDEVCDIAQQKEKECDVLRAALKKAKEDLVLCQKMAAIQEALVKKLEEKASLLEDICSLSGIVLPYDKEE